MLIFSSSSNDTVAGIISGGTHVHRYTVFMAALTGFCALCEGASLGLEAPSELSACLLMSRVVKRLDSIPRMWMIDCLLVGLGCKGRQSGWVWYVGVKKRYCGSGCESKEQCHCRYCKGCVKCCKNAAITRSPSYLSLCQQTSSPWIRASISSLKCILFALSYIQAPLLQSFF